MQVLVIGAHGNTGQRVVRQLAESETHEPIAMIRDAAQQATFDKLNVATSIGDLEQPVDDCVAGCDAVIFAAGSGGKTGKDKTVLVDHLGGIRAAVTAGVHGASRFIMLSGLHSAPDAKTGITHYHRAKGWADAWLMQHHEVLPPEHHLAWTILRPGGLHDQSTDGRVALLDDTLHSEGKASRDSVARALVGCLDAPNTIGRCFGLIDGPTPVREALAQR